eukprot:CAMPEP_0119553528 /NCGR_PEP_ID=MMETSP1352-20130426/6260_1 /TAXON_ID=265584 /ORGANISM="Stauroneis constricta, Strain CCMP1120" /LENGTH=490 /DNA_ID=CAMNT_0007599959 /DNA_START=238 /DNA_END=1710 /DNA_ORIENTATION=+
MTRRHLATSMSMLNRGQRMAMMVNSSADNFAVNRSIASKTLCSTSSPSSPMALLKNGLKATASTPMFNNKHGQNYSRVILGGSGIDVNIRTYATSTILSSTSNNATSTGTNHVTSTSNTTNSNTNKHTKTSERFASDWFGSNETHITTCSDASNNTADNTNNNTNNEPQPGSKAFLVECNREALIDLFHKFANDCEMTSGDKYLDRAGLHKVLKSVGESYYTEQMLDDLFQIADLSKNGLISLEEFLISADRIIGDAPARIVLIVGGPGSGKGLLSERLERECGVVHLSSGDLLRDEVRRDTVLGREVRDIMSRGELVSSAVIVTLMRRVMRDHPGKRVLLDGFPRSLQNAQDLVTLCGVPELALHLECDDTILMERILSRGEKQQQDESNSAKRTDDNVHTALKRLRTYHKYHHPTMEWLREQHVPVVNLDCSGTPEQVWEQLEAIGRLMRPATRLPTSGNAAAPAAGGGGGNILETMKPESDGTERVA